MSDISKVVFWSCFPEEEYLSHTNLDDALLEYYDENIIDGEIYPSEVKVYGFAREQVSEKDKEKLQDTVLSFIQEYLMETYDGEDGHDIPEAVRPLAKNLIDNYISNYTPQICRQVCSKTINLKEWKEQLDTSLKSPFSIGDKVIIGAGPEEGSLGKITYIKQKTNRSFDYTVNDSEGVNRIYTLVLEETPESTLTQTWHLGIPLYKSH